jgi:glycerophosphoryl diester phosphodiesterase
MYGREVNLKNSVAAARHIRSVTFVVPRGPRAVRRGSLSGRARRIGLGHHSLRAAASSASRPGEQHFVVGQASGTMDAGEHRMRCAPTVLVVISAVVACENLGRPDGEPNASGASGEVAAAADGPTRSSSGYWAGVRRLAQSPSGNALAIACHNCYRDDLPTSLENLRATIERIEAAQSEGADAIEIDVKFEVDRWYVGHHDDHATSGALLEDVVSDTPLAASDLLLFVELKEQTASEQQLRELLAILTSAALARPGRYLIVRSFQERSESLWMIERMLAAGEFRSYAEYIWTHVLYSRVEAEDTRVMNDLIEVALESGAEGVEFKHTASTVYELLELARARGLGTAVWTFSEARGTDKCRQFRDLADAVITESLFNRCRAAVEQP